MTRNNVIQIQGMSLTQVIASDFGYFQVAETFVGSKKLLAASIGLPILWVNADSKHFIGGR